MAQIGQRFLEAAEPLVACSEASELAGALAAEAAGFLKWLAPTALSSE